MGYWSSYLSLSFPYRFAAKARNYQLTLNAAQRYWNTCQHFVLTPLERKLLIEPIKGILNCIAEVWKYSELTKVTIIVLSSSALVTFKEPTQHALSKTDC